ncbi:HNH endonuclease [Streptomyces sp. ITFR-6]|uniref:HNH endonuclease n=1 Tax=Streptomyces sp. ITFR-6 TaxID=3075197 RepID=UPI00288ACDE3|nr:HNH endonuclease [Streptomyces sp. ITFR-6]WNI28676.1 HNH endonuclease [Streptomyces sp. ITFR-6]
MPNRAVPLVKICVRCVREFPALRKDAMYCGTTCRVAAARERAKVDGRAEKWRVAAEEKKAVAPRVEPATHTLICEYAPCGAEFEAPRRRKYCTRTCGKAVWNAAREGMPRKPKLVRKPLLCAECGETMPVRRSGPPAAYCSGTCKALACTKRAAVDGRLEQWADAVKTRHMAALLERVRQCPTCDVVFHPGLRTRTYCTAACSMRAYNARREEDGRLARYRAERRQRERDQADPSEVFRAADVYERDGWICWLCSTPINREASWPASDSRSVDHVVALSRGGGHTLANVKAAHLRCNLIKGDRAVDLAA